MEENMKTTKMNLLNAFENIVEMAQGSGLSSEFYSKAAPYTQYVSEKLNLTHEQSVLLAVLVDSNFDHLVDLGTIAQYVNCRKVRLLTYLKDLNELGERGFVDIRGNEERATYYVPRVVIEAFSRDECYVAKSTKGVTCEELFTILSDIFNRGEGGNFNAEMVKEKVNKLFEDNSHLLFVSRLKSLGLSEMSELLLTLFSHLFINQNDDMVGFHEVEFIFQHQFEATTMVNKLMNGRSELQMRNLVEFSNASGMPDRMLYCLTREAKKLLFPELELPSVNFERMTGGMTLAREIKEKQLFYDKGLMTSIDDLASLLEEDNYQQVRNRLKDKGFRCGFACLFYGEPGTGKTETVLQLARRTGRNIMQVNVEQIKSKWVGESEKNIKDIFTNYRKKAEDLDRAPILLFNEADAIIGLRNEGAQKAVDKMENAIQNIILQEMETFDGILIATTNLAGNMDKAFERRFLYKIKFNRPSLEARMSIWHSMIPDLGDSETRYLAEHYDFSGGQIENIARHFTIDNILHGEASDRLKTLISHCDSERIEKKNGKRIGF